MQSRLGDPGPMGLFLFGFTLVALGFLELGSDKTEAGAVIYGILATAVIQIICGVIDIIKGETFLGTIFGTFGAWLVGFYLILTDPTLGTPHGEGLYVLVLLGPVALLTVHAFRHARDAMKIAFVTVSLCVLTLGIGIYNEDETFSNWAGIFAFISAVPVWYIAFDRLQKAQVKEKARTDAEARVSAVGDGANDATTGVAAPSAAQPAYR